MFETRRGEPGDKDGKMCNRCCKWSQAWTLGRGLYIANRSHSVYVCLTLKSEISLPLALGDLILGTSLRTGGVFLVVASLPPKNNVCEPKRQNDFCDIKPF